MFHLIARYRFLALFVILVAFCLFKALHMQLGWFERTNVVFAILMASSLLIIGHRSKILLSLIVMLAVAELALLILRYYFGGTVISEPVLLAVVIFFLIAMTAFCLCYTLQDQTISVTTLFGSLSAYLFIGLVFAYLYMFIEWISPGAFSGLQTQNEAQVIYFSFITLTTVGYGDIVPLKPLAQTFTWMEAFTGQTYLAIIIGQLIGRYVAEHLKENTASR